MNFRFLLGSITPCACYCFYVTSRALLSSPQGRMHMATILSDPKAVNLSGDGGVTRKIIREGNGKTIVTGDIALVNFTGTIIDNGVVFSKGDKYRCTLEDGTMISGWDIGLGGLRVGDEAIIECSSRYAYGSDGVAPVVPAGASVRFNIEVLEYEGNIMNPATFADANPLTPRTPESIRIAFDTKRQIQMASNSDEELEGFDRIKKWFDKIYIFGLFESLDGVEAPWYLRPIITFPIMFGVCGVAFYCVLFLNGISTDRSKAIQDDADLALNGLEIILNQFRV